MTDLCIDIKISVFVLIAILAYSQFCTICEAFVKTYNVVSVYNGITLKVKFENQTVLFCMGYLLQNPNGNQSVSFHALTSASCLKHEHIDDITVSTKIIEPPLRCEYIIVNYLKLHTTFY